jgi:hypothetical protein
MSALHGYYQRQWEVEQAADQQWEAAHPRDPHDARPTYVRRAQAAQDEWAEVERQRRVAAAREAWERDTPRRALDEQWAAMAREHTLRRTPAGRAELQREHEAAELQRLRAQAEQAERDRAMLDRLLAGPGPGGRHGW